MRCSARVSLALFVVTLSASLVAGCDFLRQPESEFPVVEIPPTPTAIPVTTSTPLKTVRVRTGDLSGLLKVRGRVASGSEFPLSFRRAGWISALNVKIGDQVDKGALIAELDDPDLGDRIETARLALERARTALSQAQLPLPPGRSAAAAKAVTAAQQALETANLRLAKVKAPPTEDDLAPLRAEVEKAQVQVQKAKDEYDFRVERQLEAYVQELNLRAAMADLNAALGKLSQAEKGARPEDIALAEADIRSADATLQRAKADYDFEVQAEQSTRQARDAAANSAQTEVRLRMDELTRLQSRLQDVRLVAPFAGNIVSLDVQVGDKVNQFQSLGILANPNQPEIEAQIPEEALSLVSLNQSADIVIDGYPNDRYKATIRQIPAKSTLWQGKQVYLVRMGFADAKAPATIRMGSDVYLPVTRSKVLLLPLSAIIKEDDKRYVMLSTGTNIVRTSITVGLSNETDAEIISGVKESDAVAAGPVK